jgi:CheY-like chemotaxis protein
MSLAEAQHQALNGGFDDFITKPANKNMLVERVQRLAMVESV